MKKILAMVVAIVMVFGMVGCGSDTKATTSTDNTVVSPTDTQKADGIVQIEEIHFEDTGSEHSQCLHSDILKTDKLKVNGDMAGVVYVREYTDGKVKVEIVYNEE